MRVFVGLGLVTLLLGCRDSGNSSSPPLRAQANAATQVGAGGEVTPALDEPVFPIVLPLDKESLHFQQQAELNTRYADEQICAFMDDMADDLTAFRPDGLGCPRDSDPGAE